MRVYIMRHGETDWNKEDRLQGQKDIPLNESGIFAAKKRAADFKDISFDKIYSSPLIRAQHTGELITHIDRKQYVLDDRLMEMGYGKYEGVPFKQMDEAMLSFLMSPNTVAPPESVETLPHLYRRVASFLDDLKETEDHQVLVLTHGVAMRAMILYLTDISKEAVWQLPIGNLATLRADVIDKKYYNVVGI